MLKKRYLTPYVIEDLNDKMVFISGARQVGKTTLSTELITNHFTNTTYYNWDFRSDREKILKSEWPVDGDLIILDEIHKYKKWKNLIKGNYDKWKKNYKFLVTGSAKLNIFRRGGDSLQGRYHHFTLHPFSVAELAEKKNRFVIHEELDIPRTYSKDEFNALLRFGGFPEPLIKQSSRQLRRWHREKIERLFREDIREIEMVRDLESMRLLSDMLPSRVGSLLSINNLREELEVSHSTVSNWIKILESFYYHFRITPYTNKSSRAIKKEPKLYLWDWSEIHEEGIRFENLVACHLLKFVQFLRDYEGYEASLQFLRDKEKREVDFLVVVEGKPWFAVEAKWRDHSLSKNLIYFKKKLNIPFAYQITGEGEDDFLKDDVRILPAAKFLRALI